MLKEADRMVEAAQSLIGGARRLRELARMLITRNVKPPEDRR